MTDFNDALGKIKSCMLSAGDIVFGDSCVKDASLELLQPTEDSVVDHWKVFQGATAYYACLLNQALSALDQAETELRMTLLKRQGELMILAKDKYTLSRPSKDDLVIIGILEGQEDMQQLRDNVKYWEDAVRNLKSWVDTWEKKSFCLNGISQANEASASTIRSPRVPE
jgi:hypothetical protein